MGEIKQRLVLDDRKEMQVSGVRNVESFDDRQIMLDTVLGGIQLNGEGLKINGLDLEAGQITINGQIDRLEYGKSLEERSVSHKSRTLMSRLLK